MLDTRDKAVCTPFRKRCRQIALVLQDALPHAALVFILRRLPAGQMLCALPCYQQTHQAKVS